MGSGERAGPRRLAIELVLADFAWFRGLAKNTHLGIDLPKRRRAQRAEGTRASLAISRDAPAEHQWCCRPHEDIEAEWSDLLAERRNEAS